MFFVFSLSLIFVFILFLFSFFLSMKSLLFLKVCSFESGFMGVGKIQVSFSVHFFIIMIMFIIFDVEIVMLVGFVISDIVSFYMFFFILFFILGGLYLEWFFGKLLWSF